jgi:hypothetical protein
MGENPQLSDLYQLSPKLPSKINWLVDDLCYTLDHVICRAKVSSQMGGICSFGRVSADSGSQKPLKDSAMAAHAGLATIFAHAHMGLPCSDIDGLLFTY